MIVRLWLFLFAIFSWNLSSTTMAMSLQQAIERAEKHSIEIKQAKLNLENSKLDHKIVLSELMPKLSLNHSLTTGLYADVAGGERQNSAVESRPLPVFSFVQSIGNPAEIYYNNKIALVEVSKAEIDLDTQRRSLRVNIIQLYLSTQFAEQTLNTAEELKKLESENHALAKLRFQRGYITKGDFLRSEMALSTAENQLLSAQLAFANAKEELAIKLGLDESKSLQLIKSDLQPTQPQSDLDLFEAFKSGDLNLKKIQLQKLVQDYKLSMAKLDWLPEFSASATVKTPFMVADTAKADHFRASGPTYTLGMSWDIFSGGRSYAEFQQAKNNSIKQDLTQESRLQEIKILASQIQSQLNLYQNQLSLEKQKLNYIQQISKTSKQRFSQGLVNSRSLNQDFADLAAAQKAVLSSQYELKKVFVAAYEISGDEKWILKL